MRKNSSRRIMLAAMLFSFLASNGILLGEVLQNKICATFGTGDANRLWQCRAQVCTNLSAVNFCCLCTEPNWNVWSQSSTAYSYDTCIQLEGSNCETGWDDLCRIEYNHTVLNCGNWLPCWYATYSTGC